MVALRPATQADSQTLLAWANDPVTRRNSFHPEPIDAATHQRWLGDRLAAADSRLLIGEIQGRPVGLARLEPVDDGQEVSITVAPAVRGQGIGRRLLLAAMAAWQVDPDLGDAPFVARIRPDNIASRTIFEAAGFLLHSSADCDGAPCLRYVRDQLASTSL